MMVERTLSLAAAVFLILVAGCYEETNVIEYEPGVYKGEQDPLLEKIGRSDHHEQLAKRFEDQTDR